MRPRLVMAGSNAILGAITFLAIFATMPISNGSKQPFHRIAIIIAGDVAGQCDDGLDNDFDGFTDCDDTDCALDPACIPTTEVICDDSTDNDADGNTDCADTDCANDTFCIEGDATGECNDGLDNDFDGFTDCGDPDCMNSLECAGPGDDDDSAAPVFTCPDNDSFEPNDAFSAAFDLGQLVLGTHFVALGDS